MEAQKTPSSQSNLEEKEKELEGTKSDRSIQKDREPQDSNKKLIINSLKLQIQIIIQISVAFLYSNSELSK